MVSKRRWGDAGPPLEGARERALVGEPGEEGDLGDVVVACPKQRLRGLSTCLRHEILEGVTVFGETTVQGALTHAETSRDL